MRVVKYEVHRQLSDQQFADLCDAVELWLDDRIDREIDEVKHDIRFVKAAIEREMNKRS